MSGYGGGGYPRPALLDSNVRSGIQYFGGISGHLRLNYATSEASFARLSDPKDSLKRNSDILKE